MTDTPRVRDLPPDDQPFTRCGYTCRYTFPDARPVTPDDAGNLFLSITITAWSYGRHEKFFVTIPADLFREMDDDSFMRRIAQVARQVDYGRPVDELDPCGETSPMGPQEPCVLPKGHHWSHESANGADWRTNGPAYGLPWPKDHICHPSRRMQRAPREASRDDRA